MQRDRDRSSRDDVAHSLEVEDRSFLVRAVGIADRGGEDVHPGASDEIEYDLERLALRLAVRSHAVLDPRDGLDLALHLGPVLARFGDNLDRLPQVLLYGKL